LRIATGQQCRGGRSLAGPPSLRPKPGADFAGNAPCTSERNDEAIRIMGIPIGIIWHELRPAIAMLGTNAAVGWFRPATGFELAVVTP